MNEHLCPVLNVYITNSNKERDLLDLIHRCGNRLCLQIPPIHLLLCLCMIYSCDCKTVAKEYFLFLSQVCVKL